MVTAHTSKRRRPAPGAPPLAAEVAKLRALAHPVRLRLVQLFGESARTVREAADALGVPRTRLYHHVALLDEAGLVRVREKREHRGATEHVYEAVQLTPRAHRSRKRDPIRIPPALGHAVMERARAELVAALGGPSAASVRLVHLIAGDPEFVAAVRRHIREIAREAKRAAKRRDVRRAKGAPHRSTERWSLTVSLVPVEKI